MIEVMEERRGSTPIGTTDAVPSGTMVTVPSAPPKGPVPDAPVVAADTIRWWKAAETYLVTFGLPAFDFIADQVITLVHPNGKLSHAVTLFVFGLYLAWRQKHVNRIIR